MTETLVQKDAHDNLVTALSFEKAQEYCVGIHAIVASALPKKTIQPDFKHQMLSSGKVRYFCRLIECDAEGRSKIMPLAYILLEDASNQQQLHPLHDSYLQRVVSFYEPLLAQTKEQIVELNKQFGLDPILSYI
jgi:hypothetical protein